MVPPLPPPSGRRLENRIGTVAEEPLDDCPDSDIGPLAAGQVAAIAHDLNNILTGIVTYAELLRRDLPTATVVSEDAIEIQQQALRAARRVKDLFAIARCGGRTH